MSKYCDSDKLEANWFNWIVAESVPSLEPYRKIGVLWTKIVGYIDDASAKIRLKNPRHPERLHCLAIGRKYYFKSFDGAVNSPLPLEWTISQQEILGFHKSTTDDLVEAGYYLEPTADDSWKAVLDDIYNTCHGISRRFNQPTDEARNDLADEALLMVANKLKAGRLTYQPGRAPVFNLLTTTIYRCMYSILSKQTRLRENTKKHREAITAGMKDVI